MRMNKRDFRHQPSFDRPLGLPTIMPRPRRSPRTFQSFHASHWVAGCLERSSPSAAIKKRLVFLFWVSLESVGPLSGASTQTAVMEQMPLNGSPVKTSGLRQSRLSFSCSFPRALQPHDLLPIICRWQTSGRLRQPAGGPKRWSTIPLASWPAELRDPLARFPKRKESSGFLWLSLIRSIRASCLHPLTLHVGQLLI